MAETIRAPIFDEEWYLMKYPDVADAIQKGRMGSAKAHFLVHGRPEGRMGYRFDPKWYTETYPPVSRDIIQTRVLDAREHFERYGRFRGYLPHAEAVRPLSLVDQHPHNEGLWIDLPNANDMIAGKHEAGLITASQAALLSDFNTNGFVVLTSAIPSNFIDDARYDLARAYLGCYDNLTFASNGIPSGSTQWQPLINDASAAALDIHWFSPAIRRLLFHKNVRSIVQLLFDSQPIAYASRGYLRGGEGSWGRDEVLWPTTRPRHSAGVWFALETSTLCTSNPVCLPGSHQGQSVLNDDHLVGMDNLRYQPDDVYINTDLVAPRIRQCDGGLADSGAREKVLLLDRGDAVIWHAGLLHGEAMVASENLRRSVEAHYCPANVAPTFWESTRSPLIEYCHKGYYTALHR